MTERFKKRDNHRVGGKRAAAIRSNAYRYMRTGRCVLAGYENRRDNNSAYRRIDLKSERTAAKWQTTGNERA